MTPLSPRSIAPLLRAIEALKASNYLLGRNLQFGCTTKLAMTSPALVADPIRRRALTTGATGRGTRTGWTPCPLCPEKTQRVYALGRGIAMHLHAIHTPWQSSKKKRVKGDSTRRPGKRQRLEVDSKPIVTPECSPETVDTEEAKSSSWTPSPSEIEAWNEKVLQIVTDLEERHATNAPVTRQPGFDRTGAPATSYSASLPPFLQAAARGDLPQLQRLLQESSAPEELWLTRDRHGSLAEHWAAGGGHCACLRFLRSQRPNAEPPRTRRRRDGKTALHYAARHGQLLCVQFLLEEDNGNVEERSQDGTTPLHLACYGGFVPTIRYLLERGADLLATNDFGCHGLHWLGMTLQPSAEMLALLQYLLDSTSPERHIFWSTQKHGHTILHKAAQKLNEAIIEFLGTQFTSADERSLLGGPDANGHVPSQIWRSFGGSEAFAQRMEQEWHW